MHLAETAASASATIESGRVGRESCNARAISERGGQVVQAKAAWSCGLEVAVRVRGLQKLGEDVPTCQHTRGGSSILRHVEAVWRKRRGVGRMDLLTSWRGRLRAGSPQIVGDRSGRQASTCSGMRLRQLVVPCVYLKALSLSSLLRQSTGQTRLVHISLSMRE